MLPDLEYTRRGSGTPLVLLHGIGHRRQAWEPLMDRLAESFDVIAPDLSGFGQSPAFAGEVEYSMENASDHHANAQGHRVIADRLFDQIARRPELLPPFAPKRPDAPDP